MKRAECIIAIDFDGTVISRDVGYSFFNHFSNGKNDELIPFWKSGELTTRECLVREAAMVTVKKEEIYPFLDEFELEHGFRDFAETCKSQNVPLTIMSDGLDFYIEYLLKRFGIDDLPTISNKAVFEDGRIKVEFPYQNKQCSTCGTCKAERIEDYRAQHGNGCKVVFVGDGYSDVCATRAADVLFARKDLKKFCDENNVRYYNYEDFFEVVEQLTELGFLLRNQ